MTVEVIKAYLATEIECCGEYEEIKKKAYLKVLKFIENGEEEDRKNKYKERRIKTIISSKENKRMCTKGVIR